MKKKVWFYLFLLGALLLVGALAAPTQAQTVIYVDAGATGANDGSSWADAYIDLQAALVAGGDEIWVAQGTYYPTTGTDRTATFILMNGVALYGSFPTGGGDGTFEARDWEAYPTVLSGDIGTPGVNADNSYHVVVADDTNETAVLDGFTITAGNADGSEPHRYGGGIYISGGSPTLRNITFENNWARDGGGIYAANGSSPTLENCRFEGNDAEFHGGGIRTVGTSGERHNTSLTNVVFVGNTAGQEGGALSSIYSSGMTLLDVTFTSNSVISGRAGAIRSSFPEDLVLENVVFHNNSVGSDGQGGAMYVTGAGNFSMANVTFSANNVVASSPSAGGTGGALFSGGGAVFELTDVIFDGNFATALGRAGALHVWSGIGTLNNVTFLGNDAADGGAVWLERGTLSVSDSHFKGNTAQAGGALYVGDSSFSGSATANLLDSILESNTASDHGGAIYVTLNNGVAGVVNLDGSTVAGNSAGGGGGVYNTGTLNILNSAIIGNTASHSGSSGDYHGGGGIYNYQTSGIINVVNSTISGNQAVDYGGGILNFSGAQISLLNVTITGNIANSNESAVGRGGGLSYISTGAWTVRNSIIAGNIILGDVVPSYDCNISGGEGGIVEYNLMGDNRTCPTLFVHDVNGNIVGTGPDDTIDPLLGRLGDNGGPTLTHALLSGSPARDAGNPDECPAEDQRGMLRPRDSAGDGSLRCDMGAFEAGPPNDAWTRAIDISNGPADVQEYVDQPGQSRWYKFQVYPGSRVELELDPGNVNLDLALFGDIQAAYDELLAPEEESDLPRLSAEFAAAAHSPFAYSPFAYSPFAYSPFAYSPFAYSPFAYSPFAYSPFAYSPFAYSPFAYSPFAYSPFAYSPFAYSPFAYSPFAYSPFAYSPVDYMAEPEYSSAQMRTLLAISALEGTAAEFIEVNTWDNRGHFYVRISGRNGAFNLSQPFTLRVTQDLGVCEGLMWITRGENESPEVQNGAFGTLILTDWSRFNQYDPEELMDLQGVLTSFADTVEGIVVDVGQDSVVQAANAVADAAPECLYAKNQVARLIKDYVTAYREAGHPLEYLVLVGNDNVIPYFRYPDRAEIGRERDYNPPVLVGTSSYASLAFDHFLSQDAYGSTIELKVHNTTLPIADLAIGRLVETPADILNMLDVYVGTLIPESALVTGYCFLADAAEAIAEELEIGLGSSVNTLITPQEISPAQREGTPPEQAPWPASMLADKLFGDRHDLIFLAGHFSASGTLAADYETRLYTHELLASGVDLENALVYSAGCHSGYNIVNEHGVPFITLEPDWAQAFAQKGATFIGGTGYQYGDTDFLEYSERLYLEFTRELRCGEQSVGKALVNAKHAYLAGVTEMIGLDEKAVLISTLFGLPMFTVEGLSAEGCPQPPPPSIVPSTEGYEEDPGHFLDLQYADVTVSSDLTLETLPLRNVVDPDEYLNATYFSGSSGAVTKPAEPILPRERRNVHVGGYVLRGAGFRGGSYTDLLGLVPLTGGATTETRTARTPFQTDVLYPLHPWSVNYFPQLIDSSSGITWLDVTPAQFISDADGDGWEGTWRQFDDMEFRLFYSNHTATLDGGAVPSLASPPAILRVMATSTEGEVHFQVTVAGDPSAGVQEVWVTYTGIPCNGDATCWQSLDLAQNPYDSTLWQGTLGVNGAPSGEIRYVVQAVNGVGLVTLLTNHGEFYQIDVDPADPSASTNPTAPPPESTNIEFQVAPSSGAYSTEATFIAELFDSSGGPIEGQRVIFALGAQQRSALTDANGTATATFPLNASPGDYEVSVTFAGSQDHQRFSATSSFTIEKQGSTLTFLHDPGLAQYSDDALMTAQLTDTSGKPMPHKTVLFVISDIDDVTLYAVAETTNFLGQASPGRVPLPMGSYTIKAYFGEVVTVYEVPVNLTDPNYIGASDIGNLEVLPEDVTVIYTGDTVVPEGSTKLQLSAIVTQADDGALGNLMLAQVQFDVYDQDGTWIDEVLAQADADGIAVAELEGLQPGSYQVDVTVFGDYFASAPGPRLISLNLPSDPVNTGTEIEGMTYFAGGESPYTATWDWGDGITCVTNSQNDCELIEPSNTTTGQVTGIHTYLVPGEYTVRLTITDAQDHSIEETLMVIVMPIPAPEILNIELPTEAVEVDTPIEMSALFLGENIPHTAIWDWGDGTSCSTDENDECSLIEPTDTTPGQVTGSHSYTEPGEYIVTLTVADVDGLESEPLYGTVNVLTDANLQVFDLELPLDPVKVGDEVQGSAHFVGSASSHSAVWDWGGDETTCDTDLDADCSLNEPDGSTPGQVTGSHTYDEAGVYTVSLTVTDVDGNSATAIYEFVVVYDPQGGFVTGGGWIWSEAGWCLLDDVCAEAEGRANFGFVSRYRRGASLPTGNTQFNFSAGGFNFQSESYQWLVVNQGGTNAQFKGRGTINGQTPPNGDLYEFMIWAGDGGRNGDDTFRIKIWYEADGQETTVYDNGSDQVIGGGSIVIHR